MRQNISPGYSGYCAKYYGAFHFATFTILSFTYIAEYVPYLFKVIIGGILFYSRY